MNQEKLLAMYRNVRFMEMGQFPGLCNYFICEAFWAQTLPKLR